MKRPAHERCLPRYPVGQRVATFIDGFGELFGEVLQVRTQRRKYAKHYRVRFALGEHGSFVGWFRRKDLVPR